MTSNKYPWYEVATGAEIEQGDLLQGCPVLVPTSEFVFPLSPDSDVPADLLMLDVVVMTQSCDLVNNKTTDIILCPHWDLGDAGRMDTSLAKRNTQELVLKGRMPRYTILAGSNLPEFPMGIRIVDFGRIFCLPKELVRQVAANQNMHLRLRPPYREYLSQAFARFFMRVGLPQDIELPK